MLQRKHLNSEAILKPTGSLKLVGPAVHALLSYVVRRAQTSPLVLFTEAQATLAEHLRDALKVGTRPSGTAAWARVRSLEAALGR